MERTVISYSRISLSLSLLPIIFQRRQERQVEFSKRFESHDGIIIAVNNDGCNSSWQAASLTVATVQKYPRLFQCVLLWARHNNRRQNYLQLSLRELSNGEETRLKISYFKERSWIQQYEQTRIRNYVRLVMAVKATVSTYSSQNKAAQEAYIYFMTLHNFRKQLLEQNYYGVEIHVFHKSSFALRELHRYRTDEKYA